MSSAGSPLERGMAGPLPAMPSRAAESYLDFLADTRLRLMHARWGQLLGLANAAAPGATAAGEIRQAFAAVPELAAYFRIKRTVQEAGWQRVIEAYAPHRDAMAALLAEADKTGPGTVSWSPDFRYPAYACVDIHIQPGGYTRDPLAGLIYDHGTQVFFGSIAVGDGIHQRVAALTATPADGHVKRVLEIGCSIGQMTCALKRRFPEAETWGVDISAPMVRYAHWRAARAGVDVHFAQMAAEEMSFPAGHFDMIVAHIMLHELPVDIIDRVIDEAFRTLRPGGTFVIWDFPTATAEDRGYDNFIGAIDGADNGEPYAVAFVRCGVEDRLARAGFQLRYADRRKIAELGRIADKPAQGSSS